MSTRHGSLLALLAALAALTGCATTVTEVDRLHAQASYETGLSYMRDRKPAPALTALKEAVAIDPTSYLYRDTLGVLYLDLGRPDLAIEHLRRAIALNSKYADAHFHLGTALAEMRKWDEAVESYKTAIALPTLTVPEFAQQNLGLALYHLKRYAEAEEALRFALSLDPKLQAAYYHLGLLYTAQGRKEDAKVAFKQAVKLGSDSPFGQAAVARLKALGGG